MEQDPVRLDGLPKRCDLVRLSRLGFERPSELVAVQTGQSQPDDERLEVFVADPDALTLFATRVGADEGRLAVVGRGVQGAFTQSALRPGLRTRRSWRGDGS